MNGLKRIYARNCEVRRIGKSVAGPFLAANHRLGDTRCRYFYGLFHAEAEHRSGGDLPQSAAAGFPRPPADTSVRLVAVAGFSGARRWKKGGKIVNSHEWVRYASEEGLGINGGMGKVLKAFIHDVKPDDVMSYADAAWSDGDVYRKLGFEQEEDKVFPDGRRSLKFRLKVNDHE